MRLGALEPALAVVLEPVQRVVSEGVGAGQVQVAVAVKIGSRDAKGVGVVILDQVLFKPQRSTRVAFAPSPERGS